MPTAGDILAGLGAIAHDWRLLAILWHGYFAVLIVGLVVGMRLKERPFGVLLAFPMLSVSALAWIHGNWILFVGAVATVYAAFSPHLMRGRSGDTVRQQTAPGNV